MPNDPPSAGLSEIFSAPGRIPALVLLVLLILIHAIEPNFVKLLALSGFDREQQLAPRTYQPLPVRIVAIDEKSLAKYGQWPWPRTLVATLVRKIAAGHPRVLGVDIIFAETDRLSPGRLVEARPDIPPSLAHELSLLPSNEAALAEAFGEVPAVLGVGSSDEPEPAHGPSRLTIVRQSGADPGPFLISFPYFLRSLPELTAAAHGQGVVLDSPDPDGITRRLPLFVTGNGQLAPALTLEMLRIVSGVGTLGITTAPDGVQGGSVDGVFIPTDEHARVYPYFTPSYESRYISASDLLDQSYDPATLHGAIVFLGVIGQGLIDERQTPLGLMAGVEVHAQLVECILAGTLLRRPAKLYWVELAHSPGRRANHHLRVALQPSSNSDRFIPGPGAGPLRGSFYLFSLLPSAGRCGLSGRSIDCDLWHDARREFARGRGAATPPCRRAGT